MVALQKNRLQSGGRIERSKPLSFTFNGKSYHGYEGDTIASALLANDVRLVGRGFKFHRPRGIMSAGTEESNALVGVSSGNGTVPIVRATLAALEDGQKVESQNSFPSVNFDIGRFIDFTYKVWVAGFYNKTFIWPSWHWYEWFVRRTAGLGRLPDWEDATGYHHHNRHCDVLICGSGPAGLAATLSAAKSGARILLIEQDCEVGGSLLYEHAEIDGLSAGEWLQQAKARLDAADNVTVMTSSTVSGYYDHNVLTVTDRSSANGSSASVKRFWKIRAKEVVVATGAIEQPLVFDNNDRPGIMLATAALQYVNRYAVKPADSMLVATNNDIAYRTAFQLQDKGVRVPAIVEVRPQISESIVAEANKRGIPLVLGAVISDTVGTRRVTKVHTGALSPDGRFVVGGTGVIECAGVAVSGGFNPTVHLYSQAGGKLRYDTDLACFVPNQCNENVRVAGAASGQFGLKEVLQDGASAGRTAAENAGFKYSGSTKFSTASSSDYNIRPIRITPGGKTFRQWIDFQHDVTVADIELSVRENLTSIEHVKRYTAVGMSVDQGKTSNLNALTLLAELTDKPIEEVGTTTFRPQYMPVPMGVIAGPYHGALYSPERRLPAHDWHEEQGSKFDDYGSWRRPEYYAIEGRSRDEAICAEALALRNGVGLFDGSPLGKIEVQGPDAAEFLNLIYMNNALTLKPGRIRYGLMLSENGIVMDDGVFARLSDDHYLISTTAGNADRITAWLEEWHQCERPDLDLIISPVTTQWGVVTVAGPKARTLLERLDSNIDFSAFALPHMTLAVGSLLGHAVRVQRVSFSGESSFEISLPADRTKSVLETLQEEGADLGIALVGLEALLVLRTEKGYLHVGADTDGTTNPLDLGFGAIVNKKEADFVGKRSLFRSGDQREDRRQFVGVEPVDDASAFASGAHFIDEANGTRRSQGFITSACYSPILDRHIGLGLLEGGFKRKGEELTVFDDGQTSRVRIVDPVFYDPEGKRING